MRRGTFLISPLLWVVFLGRPATGAMFVRGDTNGDRALNIADAVHLIASLFLGAPPPACEDAADANDDGRLNLADATTLLAYLFLGGPEPSMPGAHGRSYDPTTDDPFTCGDFPPELDLEAEAVFDRLTRCLWFRRDGWDGFFLLWRSYRFRRDGAYHHVQFSDVLEADGRGIWNFAQTSAGGGIIYLSDGSVLRFSLLSDGTLLIRDLILEPYAGGDCNNDETEDCSLCTRSDLPLVDVPEVVEALAARPWWKADDFERGYLPDSIELGRDGRYRTLFRAGVCIQEGYWSLHGSSVILEVRGSPCRVPPSIQWPWPTFEGFGVVRRDGSLFLNAGRGDYLSGDEPPAEGRFSVEIASTRLGHLAILQGIYSRPLARGTNLLRFRIEVNGTQELPSLPIRIARRELRWTPEGAIFHGEEVLLATLDIPHLEAGASREIARDLDLGGGDIWLSFTLPDDSTSRWLFPSGYTLLR